MRGRHVRVRSLPRERSGESIAHLVAEGLEFLHED